MYVNVHQVLLQHFVFRKYELNRNHCVTFDIIIHFVTAAMADPYTETVTPLYAALRKDQRCLSYDNNMTLTSRGVTSPRALQLRAQSTGALTQLPPSANNSYRLGSIRERHSDSSGHATPQSSSAAEGRCNDKSDWLLRETHQIKPNRPTNNQRKLHSKFNVMSLEDMSDVDRNSRNRGHIYNTQSDWLMQSHDQHSDQSQHEDSSVDSGQCSDFSNLNSLSANTNISQLYRNELMHTGLYGSSVRPMEKLVTSQQRLQNVHSVRRNLCDLSNDSESLFRFYLPRSHEHINTVENEQDLKSIGPTPWYQPEARMARGCVTSSSSNSSSRRAGLPPVHSHTRERNISTSNAAVSVTSTRPYIAAAHRSNQRAVVHERRHFVPKLLCGYNKLTRSASNVETYGERLQLQRTTALDRRQHSRRPNEIYHSMLDTRFHQHDAFYRGGYSGPKRQIKI